MASTWIERRTTKSGTSYRVRFRLGGREAAPLYAGAFRTMREARLRRDWIAGELAAMRVPQLERLAKPPAAPTVAEVAARWQASRVDVADSTRLQHRSAVRGLLPLLGDRRIDTLTPSDVAALVAALDEMGRKR